MKRPDALTLALWFVVLVGAGLRIWGLGFGLPHPETRPDEHIVMSIALKFGTGDLNPHFFHYPTLFMYGLFLLYGGYYVAGLVSGRFAGQLDLIGEAVVEPTNLYLISRGLTALAGVITLVLLYRLGRDCRNRHTGLIAAFLLAVVYLHVRDSHFGVTDVPMTMLVVASVCCAVRGVTTDRIRSLVLAAILGGLAASTKYPGGISLLAALAALVLVTKQRRRSWHWFVPRALMLGVISVGCFLAGSPFVILDFSRFASDLLYESRHLAAGHTYVGSIGWWHHLSFTLRYGLGIPLLGAGIAGGVVFAIRHPRMAVVVWIFPLVYYSLIGRGYTVFTRYMVPVIPFCCLAAAIAVQEAAAGMRNRRQGLVVSVLTLLVAVPSMMRTCRSNALLARKDSRLIGREWFEGYVRPGATVYQSNSGWGRIAIASGVASFSSDTVATPHRRYLLRARTQYLSRRGLPEYEEWDFDEEAGSFSAPKGSCNTTPEFIVTESSPLVLYSRVPQRIQRLLDSEYVLVHEIIAHDERAWRAAYDEQDAFYLPYAGFAGVIRPGPNLRFYRRRSEAAPPP